MRAFSYKSIDNRLNISSWNKYDAASTFIKFKN